MDSPVPVSHTYLHEDLKFVTNNFLAPLIKSETSEGFHIVQDFLISSPLGFALTNPTKVSARSVQHIWNHSSIAENGDIMFTFAGKTLPITRDVVVRALRLPDSLSVTVSYSDTEMKNFITHIGYSGDMHRMGKLVRTKLRKEWNFFFDCLGRCFTNKSSNFDALTQFVQYIGYSLISNAHFDIASHILSYLGSRIVEGHSVYFARFVDLIFKYLCPDAVFENDLFLPVFQLNSRVFRDMIGTDRKLPEMVDVTFLSQVRHLLKERMPTVYGSPSRAMIQGNDEEIPPESNPSSLPSQTDPATSVKSQNLSVAKSKGIAESDGISQPSGLRSSTRLQKKLQGEKRAAALTHKIQPTPKRRKYLAVDSSSDSDNVVLSAKFPSLRAHQAVFAAYKSPANPDSTATPDARTDSVIADTVQGSADHIPQEPDSQRESDMHYGQSPQEPFIQSMNANRVPANTDDSSNTDQPSRTSAIYMTGNLVCSCQYFLLQLSWQISGIPFLDGTHKNLQIKVLKKFLMSTFHKNLLIKVQKNTSYSADDPILIPPLNSRPMESSLFRYDCNTTSNLLC